MTAYAPVIFFVLMLLPCLYAAWKDLSELRIPNKLVLLCLAIFLVSGPVLLDLDEFLWRFAPAGVVLVLGFVLSMTSHFGAGDAKFATVVVLFVAQNHLATFMQTYAFMALAGVIVIWAMRSLFPAFCKSLGWKSLTSGRAFPLGLPIAGALLFYYGLLIRLQTEWFT